MESYLEALPIELIGHIMSFLDLRNIAPLRLTSCNMENKTFRAGFSTFFNNKDVKLTTSTLHEMVHITSQSRLGCLLQHCTITGIVRDETTVPHISAECMSPLTEAFRNLKQHSTKGGLKSLCLRVAARIEDADGDLVEPDSFHSWQPVWAVAVHTFNVVMAALDGSHLVVHEHLDIFGSLRGCSLPSDVFMARNFASMNAFRALKKLTVSLSAPRETTSKYTEESQSELLLDMMQMSRNMPEMAFLNLHWYRLIYTGYEPILSNLPPVYGEMYTKSAPLCLKECTLRGIHVYESDLLGFLEAVCPRDLTLENVTLLSGTFASVFRYLSDPDSVVASYHLDDIKERRCLVHFDVPGNPKFRYMRGNVGPSTLTRSAGHVKETINYCINQGRALGSGERVRVSNIPHVV